MMNAFDSHYLQIKMRTIMNYQLMIATPKKEVSKYLHERMGEHVYDPILVEVSDTHVRKSFSDPVVITTIEGFQGFYEIGSIVSLTEDSGDEVISLQSTIDMITSKFVKLDSKVKEDPDNIYLAEALKIATNELNHLSFP